MIFLNAVNFLLLFSVFSVAKNKNEITDIITV